MAQKEIAGGVAHKLPTDLQKALISSPKALAAKNHIQRTVTELSQGKRRPCCWMGCIHRTDKAMSASQKWVLNRQSGSK
jgi:hypothetical protein